MKLAEGSKRNLFDVVLDEAKKAYKKIYANKKYTPEDILEYSDLINATNEVLKSAVNSGIQTDIPPRMLRSLQTDTFLFSGLKTHAQLFEASRQLQDSEGKLKPFYQFAQDIDKIRENYNKNYLQAEYEFAVSSAQMASNWSDIEENNGRYDIQYRTAQDDKVRVSHQPLHGITLPAEDAFWNQYYPPNGWRCRCTAVEVRKGKYDASSSQDAIAAGEKATSLIGKDGKNRLEIFRFNPGKREVIFPPKHPYRKVAGAAAVSAIILAEEAAAKNALIRSRNEVKEWMKSKIPEGTGLKIKTKVPHLEESILGRSSVKKMLSTGSDFPIEKHKAIMNLPKILKKAKYVGWAEDEIIDGIKKHPDVDFWKYYEITNNNIRYFVCVKKTATNINKIYSVEDETGLEKIKGIKKESPKR